MRNDHLFSKFENVRWYSTWAMLICLTCFTSHLCGVAYAQQEEEQKSFAQESFDDVSLIAASGLGGGIIGLSTLSFEKYPRQHLRHVLVGGSIGIIVGVAIVAWTKATKSNLYDEDNRVFSRPFSSSESYSYLNGAAKELFYEKSNQRLRPAMTPRFTPLAFYWSKNF